VADPKQSGLVYDDLTRREQAAVAVDREYQLAHAPWERWRNAALGPERRSELAHKLLSVARRPRRSHDRAALGSIDGDRANVCALESPFEEAPRVAILVCVEDAAIAYQNSAAGPGDGAMALIVLAWVRVRVHGAISSAESII
jgi:hypothetical protein